MLMRMMMTVMKRRRICVSPLGMLLFTNYSRNFTSPVCFVCHKKHAYQETENYTRLREPGPERRNDFLGNNQQICDKERPIAQNFQQIFLSWKIDISQLLDSYLLSEMWIKLQKPSSTLFFQKSFMITLTLFDGASQPLERRCLRRKWRGLLETFSHVFI